MQQSSTMFLNISPHTQGHTRFCGVVRDDNGLRVNSHELSCQLRENVHPPPANLPRRPKRCVDACKMHLTNCPCPCTCDSRDAVPAWTILLFQFLNCIDQSKGIFAEHVSCFFFHPRDKDSTKLWFCMVFFLEVWQISATECKVFWKLAKHSEFSLCTWDLSVQIVYMRFHCFDLASSGIHSLYFLNYNPYRDDCVKIFSELRKYCPFLEVPCKWSQNKRVP